MKTPSSVQNFHRSSSSANPCSGRTIAAKAATLVLGSTLLVSLALVTPASAVVFSFSTGAPDGLIATLSRVASPAGIQTETADDFILATNTLINQATFTGLIPPGAPLSSVSQVEVEIYHVFPADSVLPPSGNVPNRTNSPSDVEIASATRDSLDGTLSFNVTLLNGSFTALNSVVNGINKSPSQHTGGEGAVTGQEVLIHRHLQPANCPSSQSLFLPPRSAVKQ